jgi:hypothetical protein
MARNPQILALSALAFRERRRKLKMTRPKTLDNRAATAVRFPRDLHQRLKDTADERGTSVNHLVVKAAQYYLDGCRPWSFRTSEPPSQESWTRPAG